MVTIAPILSLTHLASEISIGGQGEVPGWVVQSTPPIHCLSQFKTATFPDLMAGPAMAKRISCSRALLESLKSYCQSDTAQGLSSLSYHPIPAM